MEITIGDMAEIALALTTATSLIYIGSQVKVTRQQTKGQFLLALDEQFQAARRITARAVNEPNFKPEGEEWFELFALMSVFERINIMVEDKIIDMAIVDRLYGFMLLGIIANDHIFHRLETSGSAWQDFLEVCDKLAKRRDKKGAHPQDRAFVERVRKLDKETRTEQPFAF